MTASFTQHCWALPGRLLPASVSTQVIMLTVWLMLAALLLPHLAPAALQRCPSRGVRPGRPPAGPSQCVRRSRPGQQRWQTLQPPALRLAATGAACGECQLQQQQQGAVM
jgi:hypothetical protein